MYWTSKQQYKFISIDPCLQIIQIQGECVNGICNCPPNRTGKNCDEPKCPRCQNGQCSLNKMGSPVCRCFGKIAHRTYKYFQCSKGCMVHFSQGQPIKSLLKGVKICKQQGVIQVLRPRTNKETSFSRCKYEHVKLVSLIVGQKSIFRM